MTDDGSDTVEIDTSGSDGCTDFHPSIHARTRPDAIAVKLGESGACITYRDLENRSNQGAHLFRTLGLRRGDVVAILMENNDRYHELVWAAQRSGLYFTCISTHLSVTEAAYIVDDCGARVLVTSHSVSILAAGIAGLCPGIRRYMVNGAIDSFEPYEPAAGALPSTPISDQSAGAAMLYSSGTTGRPKGVKPALPTAPLGTLDPLTAIAVSQFGFDAATIFLSPAPLYHAAPLLFSMCAHKVGATVVFMDKFDAEQALAIIEHERITHSQWVPTHFIRMLKLPREVRSRYDLGSQRLTFHAAAPCPVLVKRAMLEWWGPIVHEFYSGTEVNGLTTISPEDWLRHPGSVGTAKLGIIHVLNDDGSEAAIGDDGLIYFEGGSKFVYHNDPAKTDEAYNDRGWSTLGDIGHVDADGYLYLTDRRSFMIISGGVNVYPQEIEDVIIAHPGVADVAVIGAPDDDMGEKIVAVIQPLHMDQAGPALAADVEAHIKRHLGGIKVPRQIDFMLELPRQPNGKLYKRLLRARYWSNVDSVRSSVKSLL